MNLEEAQKLLREINKFQKKDILINLNTQYDLCIKEYTYIIKYINPKEKPSYFTFWEIEKIDDVSIFIQENLKLFKDIILRIEEEILKNA